MASRVGSVSAFVVRFVVCGVGSVYAVLGRVCGVGSVVSFPSRLFQQRLRKFQPLLLILRCYPVFAKKKEGKNFLSVLCCARPPFPQNSKLTGVAAHGYAFFPQVVALMSAAASTLNLGGKGGEQQNEQNDFAFFTQRPE